MHVAEGGVAPRGGPRAAARGRAGHTVPERVGSRAPDSQKYVIPSCFLGYRGTVIVEDTDVKPVVALPTT